METATPTGVEAVPNPRDEIYNEIIKKSREARDKEIEESGGKVVDTLTPPDGSEEEPEKQEPEPEKKEPEKKEPEKKDEPELVTIKVDGQTRQVSKAQIEEFGIRALQKELTSDERLEKATKLLKDAEERINRVSKDPEKRPDDAALARAIQTGTEDEAADAVRILKGTVEPEQIVAMAEARVMTRLQFENVRKDYADILDDPYLATLVVMEDDKMLADGDKRPPFERLPDIAKKLREWRGVKEVTVDPMKDKKDLKATVTNLPSASQRKTAPAQPKPKTQSEIIEEMRQQREGRRIRS